VADEVVNISLQADIQQLKSALAQLPDIGGKEAAKMVKALEKQYRAAERAAKQAGQNSEKEWSKSLDNLQRVGEKTASMLGGAFGDVGDVVFDMGSKLGAIGGPAGIAVAGVAALALGAAGAASAIDDFIASADDGIERLKDISGSKPIPPDTIQALDEYRQASLGAEAAAATLRVEVAGLASAAFAPAANYAAGLGSALVELLPSANAVKDAVADVAHVSRVATGVMTLGASEAVRYALGVDTLTASARDGSSALRDLARDQEALNAHMSAAERVVQIQSDAILAATGASDAQQRLARDTDAIDTATRKYIETLDLEDAAQRALADAAFESAEARKRQLASATAAAEAEKALAEAKKRAAEAERRHAEDAKIVNEGLREQRAAREALAAVVAESAADQLSDEDKINAAYATRIEKIRQAAAATLDYGAAAEAEALAEDRRQRDLAALRVSLEEGIAKARASASEEAARLEQEAMDRTREALANVASGVGALTDGLSSVQSIVQSITGNMIEQAETGTKAEKAAAKAAFNRAKAMAIVLATIDAARAAMALLPAYAYLGPGAPFAAAATAGLALAAQVATIQSQKPPSFERGGVVLGGSSGSTPDHVRAEVQPGEGIVTKRGMARLGRDGLEGLNRGDGGGGRPVQLAVQLNGRQIAQAMYDPLGSLVEGRPLGRPALG
jgi:hypothetical protein